MEFVDASVISVRKIVTSKPTKVYGITTSGDGSFILKGVVTHNTGVKGSAEFKSYFGEAKPPFKSTWAGMSPRAPLRRALFTSKDDIEKIMAKEFS